MIPPGGSASFGFNGSRTRADTAPSAVTLSDTSCTVKTGWRQASCATARGRSRSG
ncbi:hypothetical protein [Kitasatospora griseola]|uniref:hypothetical protein n=1 Tax=Kitasatospora griseola TaxID=2064 RepID=UPI003570F175